MKKAIIILLSFIITVSILKPYLILFAKKHQNEFLHWYYRNFKNSDTVIYKYAKGYPLKASLFYPKATAENDHLPTLFFIHGGSWLDGGINQFYKHVIFFQSKGYLCILLEYRVKLRHNSTPIESLDDIRDAINYFGERKKEFNINLNEFSIIGASAGGFLALAYTFTSYTLKNSSHYIPKKIILYSPVVDISKDGFGNSYFKENEAHIYSPISNIPNQINTDILIFHGAKDKLIPIEKIISFEDQYNSIAKGSCTIIKMNDLGHRLPKYKCLNWTLSECQVFLSKTLSSSLF